MKIVLINGQNHKGTTHHIARMLIDQLDGDVTEFFLPWDFGAFCTGCAQCIRRDEVLCPHAKALAPITRAMDAADVLIFTTPVYVYHATGAMKTFLDHYGWRWIIHRPEPSMFKKQAVVLATAAGAGMKSAIKDVQDSLFFWGVGKIYTFGIATHADAYAHMTEKKQRRTARAVSKIAERIKIRVGRVRPGLKTRLFFRFYRKFILGHLPANDQAYWAETGLKQHVPW